jgi:hypothetical protein
MHCLLAQHSKIQCILGDGHDNALSPKGCIEVGLYLMIQGSCLHMIDKITFLSYDCMQESYVSLRYKH